MLKPFTKEVLEQCTDLLQQQGFLRRRRGLGVWAISDEIRGAVALQHRDFPDGTVQIDTFPQVYWEPVQRLYSAGLNVRYRTFEQPTRSRIWSFLNLSEPDLVFVPESAGSENLVRLSAHIERRVVGKMLELAKPENILKFYLEKLPHGGQRPEMYLCLKAWMNRTLKLDDELQYVISLLDHDEFMDGLNTFYAQLKNSTHAQNLIAGDVV